MASTAAGNALTAQHRLDQIRIRTATVRDLIRIFEAFDPAQLSKSWASIEPILVAIIQARQPISAALAGQYLADFRRAEMVVGNAGIALAQPLTADEIIPNLRYVGVQNAFRLDQLNRPPAYITKTTLTRVEGEVTRQILNGGRTTIVGTVRNDRKAIGYARVTDGAPCAFCAMLAGRGPVYNSQASGDFHAHGKCGCTAEPVYRAEQPWPPSAKKWDDLYAETAKAVPKDAPDWSSEVRREFRRRYEAATT